MHIIQMAQEQHVIYFGYAFLGVLGKFYRNRKGLKHLDIDLTILSLLRPFYGYHMKEKTFMKIYLYNPQMVKR